MCGVVGIVAQQAVAQSLYNALVTIQHRGQDAAGIVTAEGKRIFLRKAKGLVADAVQPRHLMKLKGSMGLGHVRYPTAGAESAAESQPFYVNSPYGLSLVHNGNLINTAQLTQEVVENNFRQLNTESDSELLLNVFAFELSRRVQMPSLQVEHLFDALQAVSVRLSGAYAVILMITNFGLLAFRDPHGIRPLVYGKRQDPASGAYEYMVASESVALEIQGYQVIEDVKPGQAIFIDKEAKSVIQFTYSKAVPRAACLFEYIYLARPDSIIDGISVYEARLAMGRTIGKRILQSYPCHNIDVVVPVPDTSRIAAYAVSEQLGVPYAEGFVKNRYIGRTFIMPTQRARQNKVRLKLNVIKQALNGKNVLLVDDSIIRGTTSKSIIQMVREAGARSVFIASAAPKVKYPNCYGIDMPTTKELIASGRSTEAIAELIGADWLLYPTVEEVCLAINSVAALEDKIPSFEDSIFTGKYCTEGVDEQYFLQVEKSRKRSKNRVASTVDALYNVSHEEQLEEG